LTSGLCIKYRAQVVCFPQRTAIVGHQPNGAAGKSKFVGESSQKQKLGKPTRLRWPRMMPPTGLQRRVQQLTGLIGLQRHVQQLIGLIGL